MKQIDRIDAKFAEARYLYKRQQLITTLNNLEQEMRSIIQKEE